MPIVNGAYNAPTWNNNAPPAIDASELQDMCDTIETYSTQKANVSLVNTFVRPNLLDNWYFVGGGSQQGGGQFPVNQRGSTLYTLTGMSLDRWRTASYNGLGDIAVNADGVKLTHGDGGYIDFHQTIEDVQRINGKEVTVSAMVDGVVYSNTFTVGATGYVAFGNLSMHRINPGSDANANVFLLRASDSTGGTIQAVKLELGSTQTLAHQENGVWVLNEIPNYQQELARCQRYYQNLNLTGDNYVAVGLNTAQSSTKANVVLYLPVAMRTTPTVGTTGSWTLVNGQTAFSVTNITVDRFYGTMLKLAVTASGMTTGTAVLLEANGAGTITLSADL